MTQLTLTLPDDLALQAEAYARETGRSLENIVAACLENVVKAHTQLPPLSPQVRRLLGAITLPPDFDYSRH
ncbi:MAG: hypothetical protein H7Z21_00700 [Hymenobacter sp.]|nr:hypothetical protein [Hymenobacter sp.]